MSLTDSNKKKNYSNKDNGNMKVAKIDKKTTLAEHFGKGGKIYFGKAKDYPGTTGIIKKENKKLINGYNLLSIIQQST